MGRGRERVRLATKYACTTSTSFVRASGAGIMNFAGFGKVDVVFGDGLYSTVGDGIDFEDVVINVVRRCGNLRRGMFRRGEARGTWSMVWARSSATSKRDFPR